MVIVRAAGQDHQEYYLPGAAVHAHWLAAGCGLGCDKPAKQPGRQKGPAYHKGNEISIVVFPFFLTRNCINFFTPEKLFPATYTLQLIENELLIDH